MVKVKKEAVLIKPEMIKPSSRYFKVTGVLNPGATRDSKGNVVLYVRVIEELIKKSDQKYYFSPRLVGSDKYQVKIDKFSKDLVDYASDLDFVFKDGTKRLTFISHLRKVVLDKSGFKIKSIEQKPSFYGIHSDGELGVEDARITKIGDSYYMTYVTLSRHENVSSNLAVSKDLKKWKRLGIIFGEQDKDVVLFPEKIKGKYVVFDRPEGNFSFTPPHIWAAFSKDLIAWGKLDALNLSKKGDWDYERVGAGPPPIKTEKGWLFIYHGVMTQISSKNIERVVKRMNITEEMAGVLRTNDAIYCVGAALLDLKNPKHIISKTKVPLLFPIRKNEISVEENKRVIFATGLVRDEDYVLIYSGAGDRYVTVKRIALNNILKKLKV